MQVAVWSNMHGQAATSATAAALACMIAQNTAMKTLVAHNHIERSALEGYFIRHSPQAYKSMPGLSNQGIDALSRLMKNGRLKPEMIADYTFSVLKDHRLDILTGTTTKKSMAHGDEETLMSILHTAEEFYDIILLDLHSGLYGNNSISILEKSDLILFCINQNRFLLEDLTQMLKDCPSIRNKKSAFVLTRYENGGMITPGYLSRHYKLNRSTLFDIPNDIGFADALNNGKAFEYIAFCSGNKRSGAKSLIGSLKRLCDYVVEGCAEKCRKY